MAVRKEREQEDVQDRRRDLQDLLEANRRRLQMEIDRMAAQLQRTPDLESGGDVADRAVHGLDQDVSAQTLEQLGQTLQQINEALVRHEDGEYGFCQSCGREIPIERLRALPFALYCRDCQERMEGPSPGNPPRM